MAEKRTLTTTLPTLIESASRLHAEIRQLRAARLVLQAVTRDLADSDGTSALFGAALASVPGDENLRAVIMSLSERAKREGVRSSDFQSWLRSVSGTQETSVVEATYGSTAIAPDVPIRILDDHLQPATRNVRRNLVAAGAVAAFVGASGAIPESIAPIGVDDLAPEWSLAALCGIALYQNLAFVVYSWGDRKKSAGTIEWLTPVVQECEKLVNKVEAEVDNLTDTAKARVLTWIGSARLAITRYGRTRWAARIRRLVDFDFPWLMSLAGLALVAWRWICI